MWTLVTRSAMPSWTVRVFGHLRKAGAAHGSLGLLRNRSPRIGDIVITTLNNAVAVTDTLESLFAKLDLRLNGTDGDLVIDELDQWRNPERTLPGRCVTYNLVVVAQDMSRR